MSFDCNAIKFFEFQQTTVKFSRIFLLEKAEIEKYV